MTREEAWAIRDDHLMQGDGSGVCRECGAAWPCRAIQEAVSTTSTTPNDKQGIRRDAHGVVPR